MNGHGLPNGRWERKWVGFESQRRKGCPGTELGDDRYGSRTAEDGGAGIVMMLMMLSAG
jgi:hypothetical protein